MVIMFLVVKQEDLQLESAKLDSDLVGFTEYGPCQSQYMLRKQGWENFSFQVLLNLSSGGYICTYTFSYLLASAISDC